MIIKDLFEKVLIDQRLVIIDHNSSAYEAAVSMLKNKCGALLVCDHKNDDTLLGIISERDLTFRVIPKDLDPKKTKFSKIGQNRPWDRFWADLGLKFGFCVKSCIGTSVQTSISLFFVSPVFYKSGFC